MIEVTSKTQLSGRMTRKAGQAIGLRWRALQCGRTVQVPLTFSTPPYVCLVVVVVWLGEQGFSLDITLITGGPEYLRTLPQRMLASGMCTLSTPLPLGAMIRKRGGRGSNGDCRCGVRVWQGCPTLRTPDGVWF